jgi:hypothetical protein
VIGVSVAGSSLTGSFAEPLEIQANFMTLGPDDSRGAVLTVSVLSDLHPFVTDSPRCVTG